MEPELSRRNDILAKNSDTVALRHIIRLFPLQFAIVLESLSAAQPIVQPVQPDILFEEQSSGQDGSSAFVSRNGTYSIRLSRAGGELVFAGVVGQPGSLSFRLAGSANAVPPRGSVLSSGSINYFVGSDSKWRRHVKAYTEVTFPGIYKGVDLVFYGHSGRLEHDFLIAPGSSPSTIQVEWFGASHLGLSENGDLLIYTSSRSEPIQWTAPFVYQRVHGAKKRIDGHFKLLGPNRVGIQVGRFDPRRELVVDPALVFSTYEGGSRADVSHGIATDASNNVYVTGYTTSPDLPVTRSAYQTEYAGSSLDFMSGDAFVAKYSPLGTLIFLTYLGGSRYDIGLSLATDSAGNVYVGGFTNSMNFPVTPGAFQHAFAGCLCEGSILTLGDGFVAKLSSDGSTLLYSTYIGGSGDDGVFAIAVDGPGNAYITGTTLSPNFPTTPNAYQSRNAGHGGQETRPAWGFIPAVSGGDVFVAKLNPAGSALVYSTFVGGVSDDFGTAIAIDAAGNAYVGGFTISSDFPVTAGSFQTTFGGTDPLNQFFNFGDGFLLKLNSTGSALIYSTFLGGSGDDWVSAIAIDSSMNLYATGSTSSHNFPVTQGAFQSAFNGPTTLPFFVDQLVGDAFVTKLNPAGTQLVFSTYLGGAGDDVGLAVALDAAGNVVVGGATNSLTFPVTADAFQPKLAGPGYLTTGNTAGDGFLAAFTPAGARSYATYFGGIGDDGILSLVVTGAGNAYVSGLTGAANFPVAHAAQPVKASPGTLGFNSFVASFTGFAAAPTAPVITSVVSATGDVSTIAQNAWIQIFGANLAPDMRIWGGSDFVNGQMPTALDGVSVTVNGKPAFVYYISSGQVNVLAPLDTTTGSVLVQLTNGKNSTAPVPVQAQSYAPGFFEFGSGPYVAAVHADGSLVGPTTLYPGSSTPAKPGEVIEVFGTGFGQTSPPIVNGAATQSGVLTPTPTITIGGVTATVQFAGVVAPGEYQFNVVVPATLGNGNAAIQATFNGQTTQPNAQIAIQQ